MDFISGLLVAIQVTTLVASWLAIYQQVLDIQEKRAKKREKKDVD